MGLVLNITGSSITKRQKKSGVIQPTIPGVLNEIKYLIVFSKRPDNAEITRRVNRLLSIYFEEWKNNPSIASAMMNSSVGASAPFLIAPIERAFGEKNIPILYAFSEYVYKEIKLPNRQPEKVCKGFKHVGFVENVYGK